MVGEQAPLVSPHAKMIDEDGTGSGWFRGRVEGAFEGSKNVGDIFIEVTYFPRRLSYELRLIRW